MPANCSGGGVFETTRRFQDASAAFMRPARRPTRGSGLGATVDMFAPPEDAHAPSEHNPMATTSDRRAEARLTANVMADPSEETRRVNERGRTGALLAGPLEQQRGEHLL